MQRGWAGGEPVGKSISAAAAADARASAPEAMRFFQARKAVISAAELSQTIYGRWLPLATVRAKGR